MKPLKIDLEAQRNKCHRLSADITQHREKHNSYKMKQFKRSHTKKVSIASSLSSLHYNLMNSATTRLLEIRFLVSLSTLISKTTLFSRIHFRGSSPSQKKSSITASKLWHPPNKRFSWLLKICWKKGSMLRKSTWNLRNNRVSTGNCWKSIWTAEETSLKDVKTTSIWKRSAELLLTVSILDNLHKEALSLTKSSLRSL